jgi:hypothetical protein
MLRTPELAPYQREALQNERLRCEGFIHIGTAINAGETGRSILPFYLLNAHAFIPDSMYAWAARKEITGPTLTKELISHTAKIFDRDIAAATKFKEGVDVIRTDTNGKKITEKKYLGDLLDETHGRVMEIDAALAGREMPKAPTFDEKKEQTVFAA